MSDILTLAKADLVSKRTLVTDLRAQLAQAEQDERSHTEFVTKLEGYVTGKPISPVTYEIDTDVPLLRPIRRKTLKRIPRPDSKRYQIGVEALKAIAIHGPMPSRQLLKHIDPALLESSEQPQNYLSNALSKDARFDAGRDGWFAKDTSSFNEGGV